jgi:hypothetical protein
MLRKKLFQTILAAMVLLSVLAIPASASPVAVGSGVASAAWVRYQPWRGEEWTYGVFITPTGAHDLSLIYRLNDGRGYSLNGGNQCRIGAVVGPGYISDPDGMNSAYVPRGYIGMAICASTRQAVFLSVVMGQNMWDRSRWLLYYLK